MNEYRRKHHLCPSQADVGNYFGHSVCYWKQSSRYFLVEYSRLAVLLMSCLNVFFAFVVIDCIINYYLLLAVFDLSKKQWRVECQRCENWGAKGTAEKSVGRVCPPSLSGKEPRRGLCSLPRKFLIFFSFQNI